MSKNRKAYKHNQDKLLQNTHSTVVKEASKDLKPDIKNSIRTVRVRQKGKKHDTQKPIQNNHGSELTTFRANCKASCVLIGPSAF